MRSDVGSILMPLLLGNAMGLQLFFISNTGFGVAAITQLQSDPDRPLPGMVTGLFQILEQGIDCCPVYCHRLRE